MHIYTLPRTPGAAITTRWETFCRSRNPFIVIEYEPYRRTGRWTHVDRVRKFGVTYYRPRPRGIFRHSETTWYVTLEKAESAASKLMAEKTADWSAAQDDGWRGHVRK
jgi:hypothetical protein